MRNQSLKIFFLMLLVLYFLIPYFSFSQEKEQLTVEWIYSKERREVTALPSFFWLKDGTLILFDYSRPDSERTFEKLNPNTGKRNTMLDREKALSNMKQLLGEQQAPSTLYFPDSFDGNSGTAVYILMGDIFLLNISSAEFERITETEEEEQSVNFSPNGEMLAFIRENDLYVYNIKEKIEKRLTTDGSETMLNGTLSWVYWEEIFGRQDIGFWWSEDSKAIAYLQTDESLVSVMHYVDFKPNVPAVITQRYPKAGGKNPMVRVGIIELDNPKTVWLDIADTSYEYIARAKWFPDSRQISVQTLNRAQTELHLYFCDRLTGKATHILTETDSAWVNIHDDLFFLQDSDQFIWESERDGYAHLYRYTLDGKLVNQITKGNWAVRSAGGAYWLRQAIQAIDEKEDWIYFTALEKSSIERHLYRIKFDGTKMQRLTKEDGFHIITFSPNAKYYVDMYSKINTLPSLSLHRNNGELVTTIGKSRPELLEKFAIQYPELFTILTADSFPMPASILKPKNFDPTKKYPLILNVYGGPSAPTIAHTWNSSIFFDQMLLNNGYLVASVDNRSATAISKILENSIYKQGYGKSELNDLLDAVKWFKAQSWIDPERVGIWGWSGGGTFTLNAMIHSREFKAGIAVASVTDWHYYDTFWTEFAMKRPEDNPEGYEKTSLVKNAQNLQGRLLIIHGTYDDNVHIQNTWAFVDELIKAGKMFDMMIYPMRKHGISDRPARIHLYNTMLEFWKENL